MAKTKLGQELVSGLTEALEYKRGEKKLITITLELPGPARRWTKREITKLRLKTFGVSQPVFASILSVTVSTVRSWEQGLKTPSGAARRLLEVAEMDPGLFRRLAREKGGQSTFRRIRSRKCVN